MTMNTPTRALAGCAAGRQYLRSQTKTAGPTRKPFWLTSNGVAAILVIGAVGYFLIIEHREHLFKWLPWLILALCPLIHIFMHRGHDHDHEHGGDRDERDHARHKHGE